MDDKINISLTKKQRDLLLKYEPFFVDHELFRLIAIAVKKGNKYEIFPDGDQLEDLLDQVSEFCNNETDEKNQENLDEICDFLEQYSYTFSAEDEGDDKFPDDDEYYSIGNTGSVCVIKVALDGDKKIWRKIAIREGQTLHYLHNAIYDAFDRYDPHMYSFFFPHTPKKKLNIRDIYRNSDEFTHPYACEVSDFSDGKKDGGKTTIESLELIEGQKFYYLFDFGDEWWHELTVEKVDGNADSGKYPRVIDHKGKSPDQYPDFEDEENW